ncbi:MAG: tRNA pseudouridine(13) synthase TruD [Halobacteriales archaeon]
MREAHPAELPLGLEFYGSEADGTGGRLRRDPESFRVREIEDVDPEPAGADAADYNYLLVRATLADWDTNAFARALSNRLGISRNRIAWAGTKDKRAVTTQLVTIAGIEAAGLPDIDGVELEPVGRLGRPLEFGDLVGNRFEVTVAEPEQPGQAAAVTADLREFGGVPAPDRASDGDGRIGIPNYFGHQRFGSIRPVTHVVGRRIVRRDWEGAVMAYLGSPTEDEPPDTQAARAFVEETRDWAAAAERFPTGLTYERTLCLELAGADADSPAAFRRALDALPWNLRRLFVNAVQSEAFNRILSRRLERGLPFDRAVEGDVVCFGDLADGFAVPDTDSRQRVTADRVETVNRHVERGRAFVTAPLVGTDTELGEGDPGEIERGVLKDLELAPDQFDLPDPYHSTGTRRTVLLQTTVDVEVDPLVFRFALPAGAYATVLLREYLKVGPQSL